MGCGSGRLRLLLRGGLRLRHALPYTGGVRTLVIATCQTCRKAFRVSASRFKHGRGKSCSPACQYEAKRRRPHLRVTLTCVGCGAEFTRWPSHAASVSGKGKFCSRACRDKNRTAALHPQFLGGPSALRGANWQAQRRRARRRDERTCRHCREQGTDVHHIRPFRLFVDYREANRLANLVTLCRPCHRRADAVIQRSA